MLTVNGATMTQPHRGGVGIVQCVMHVNRNRNHCQMHKLYHAVPPETIDDDDRRIWIESEITIYFNMYNAQIAIYITIAVCIILAVFIGVYYLLIESKPQK